VIQWSGDTLAFGDALRRARRAGLPALNGGDTRFDAEFPSVAWVAPVGRWDDGDFQIYASASNENTYTRGWSRRYYGFKYARQTFERTELPRRLKPIDVYYHVFSGDKRAGLSAVTAVLDWARTQEITPVRTSHYAQIAAGFYSTRIVLIGERTWRIEGRGALQTLRFDTGAEERVDLARSIGILGERHTNGSLYVALDPDVDEPVVALEARSNGARTAFLRHSRWPIHGLARDSDGFGVHFRAQGFGSGEMVWALSPLCRAWFWTLIRANEPARSGRAAATANGEVNLALGGAGNDEAAVQLKCVDRRG
jgi:hypothetical protein